MNSLLSPLSGSFIFYVSSVRSTSFVLAWNTLNSPRNCCRKERWENWLIHHHHHHHHHRFVSGISSTSKNNNYARIWIFVGYFSPDLILRLEKNGKFSHTGHRTLGPELIPVYRQSTRRWLFKSCPAVGCHYFPPALRSPSQPKNVAVLRPVPSYTAWWQRHIDVNNLQGFNAALQCPRWEYRTHNLMIASPTLYRYPTSPPFITLLLMWLQCH